MLAVIPSLPLLPLLQPRVRPPACFLSPWVCPRGAGVRKPAASCRPPQASVGWCHRPLSPAPCGHGSSVHRGRGAWQRSFSFRCPGLLLSVARRVCLPFSSGRTFASFPLQATVKNAAADVCVRFLCTNVMLLLLWAYLPRVKLLDYMVTTFLRNCRLLF